MTAVIRTEQLVVEYRSGRRAPVRALDGLDLVVEQGEIFGFLGPNGAGKSTTIRVLMDLVRPTSGRVEVLGSEPRAGGPATRARIGYLPGELVVPDGRRTAGELLGYLTNLRGGRGADRVAVLAERLGLDLDRPMRGLSRGNRQKVGVVQAFAHRPDLLVLDEPTSGLDPLLQREFLDLVREARDDGATVLMSSHVLSEVEDVAGRVAIIRAGRLVDVDDVRTLRHHAGQRVELRFAVDVRPADFADLPGVEDLDVDGRSLTCLLHGEPDALLKAAARHHVTGWSAEDRELEDLFLDFYRVPVHGGPANDAGRSDAGRPDADHPEEAMHRG